MTDAAQNSIDAAEFFKAHAGEAKDYVQVYAARALKVGESRVADIGGLNIQTRTETAGYELARYTSMHDSKKVFLGAQAFAEKTAPADTLAPAVPREDLTAEDMKAFTPVAKGDRIAVDVGLPIITNADMDGFTVKTGDEKSLPVFLSNYAVSTLFNYAGAKKHTHEDLIVRIKDEPELKGIILKEETTFAFKEGDYTALAGSFLFENKEDVDGYTVMPPGFAQFALREAPGPEQSVALESAVAVRKKPVGFKK